VIIKSLKAILTCGRPQRSIIYLALYKHVCTLYYHTLSKLLVFNYCAIMSDRLRPGQSEADRDIIPKNSKLLHELKNPVHGILGLSEYLTSNLNAISKEECAKYIRAIYESSKILLNIIESVSMFADQNGPLNFSFIKKNIVNAIEDSIRDFKNLYLEQNSLEIEFNHNIPADKVVEYDTSLDIFWFKQVLMNLLINALTHSKGVKIVIELATQSKNAQEYFTLKISDDGIGISPDILNNIFEPFHSYRANNSLQEDQSYYSHKTIKNSGIGLSLCREIIEAHGGVIYAQNNQDKGVSFIIEIPKREIV